MATTYTVCLADAFENEDVTTAHAARNEGMLENQIDFITIIISNSFCARF